MALLNTIAPEKAQGKVKEVYSLFENMDIPVPLPMQMLSASPEYLAIQSQLIGYMMAHPNLSPGLLTHIRLLTAHEENYAYCTDFNQQLLKAMDGVSDEYIETVKEDPSNANLEPREIDLLLFVRNVLRDPALTRQEDMDRLRAQGWTDSDIFDATVMGMNMMATGIMFKAFKMAE